MLHTILMSAVLSTFAWADEPAKKEKKNPFPLPDVRWSEVALGAGFGIAWIDKRAWNDEFARRQWASLGPIEVTPLSINGELYANRHVPGFDFISYRNVGGQLPDTTGTPNAPKVWTILRYTLTELSYGFAFIHTPGGFSLVPRIGFGLMDVEMNAEPEGDVDWNSIGNDAKQSTTVTKQSMIMDLGIGITYGLAIGRRDRVGIHPGFRFTIRAGAMVQLFDTAGWNASGNSVSNAPSLRLDGPYVRFIFAPSLIHRHKHK